MKPITQQEIVNYVEANIQTFHQRRLDKLQEAETDECRQTEKPLSIQSEKH